MNVLTSIKPEYCELIAAGKKEFEVRTTRPKIDTPFKVYIYCTNGRLLYKSKFNDELHLWMIKESNTTRETLEKNGHKVLSGKVIGEFICDYINDCYADDYQYGTYDFSDDELKGSCLTQNDLWKYAKGKDLYLWHISDLVIYDEPKELREFTKEEVLPLEEIEGFPLLCNYCSEQEYNGYNAVDNTWYNCGKGNCFEAYEEYKKALTIKRPPQSWCYVEGNIYA